MRKNIVILIFIITYSNVFTQRIKSNVSDSTTINELIQNEISHTKKNYTLISIFDQSGKIYMITVKEKKINANKQFYKGKSNGVKSIKISNQDQLDIMNLVRNPAIINKLSENKCSDIVHSFNKVSIMIYDKDGIYKNYFFTNCSQKNYLVFLYRLYFSLNSK